MYREIFVAVNYAKYGFGPWMCFVCKEPVEKKDLNIHHVDEDHENDEPTNLAAIHHNCHARMPSRPLSLAWRKKIGDALRGRCGYQHTVETRAKISESLKRAYAEGRHVVVKGNAQAI